MKKAKKTFKDLLKIAEKLRSKNGCPWDKKQTVESMLEHLIEEAEEVKQAIEKRDHPNLKEELGDLLFQIIMISQIASEAKLFHMDDVINDIAKKIIRRHTWVFGKEKAHTPEDAVHLWLKNKKKEYVGVKEKVAGKKSKRK